MKWARVCGHELYVPDNVADWDAVAGDSSWEKERMESILETMQPGDVLYDIGAEHGWMSAIYAQRVGGENMALVEPSAELWPNIRLCWEWNELLTPLVTAEAFADTTARKAHAHIHNWPRSSGGPECGAMAYRHPNLHADIPRVSIDYLALASSRPPVGITIDVEGAELAVLRGAEGTLDRHRPYVWVSVHPDLMAKDFDTHPDQLFGFMLSRGYKPQHLRTDHEQHFLLTPEERL
jgi:FkbM family methyltransferase